MVLLITQIHVGYSHPSMVMPLSTEPARYHRYKTICWLGLVATSCVSHGVNRGCTIMSCHFSTAHSAVGSRLRRSIVNVPTFVLQQFPYGQHSNFRHPNRKRLALNRWALSNYLQSQDLHNISNDPSISTYQQ